MLGHLSRSVLISMDQEASRFMLLMWQSSSHADPVGMTQEESWSFSRVDLVGVAQLTHLLSHAKQIEVTKLSHTKRSLLT